MVAVIAVLVAPGVSRRLGRALAENEGISLSERTPSGPVAATDAGG